MREWQLQTAKAKFSEFLDACLQEGPQVVTRRGVAAAVLVPMEQWKSLQTRDRVTLKDLLLAPGPRSDALVGPRGRFRPRPPA